MCKLCRGLQDRQTCPPIEHAWDLLGRRVRLHHPHIGNVRELERALVQEWDAITDDEIRTLIRSMHQRCLAVVKGDGGHTRF